MENGKCFVHIPWPAWQLDRGTSYFLGTRSLITLYFFATFQF